MRMVHTYTNLYSLFSTYTCTCRKSDLTSIACTHTHTHTEAEALWQHRTSKHSRRTDVRPDWLSRASRFEYSRIFASGTAAVDSSASEGGACGRGGAGLEVEGGSAASRFSQNHSSKHDCGVCQISFDSEEALCGFLVFLRAACACPIACGSGFVTWSMCVRVGTRIVCIPAQWNIRLTAIGADFPSCVLCVSACGCVWLCVCLCVTVCTRADVLWICTHRTSAKLEARAQRTAFLFRLLVCSCVYTPHSCILLPALTQAVQSCVC